MSNNLPALQTLSVDLGKQSKQIQSMLPDGLDVKKFLRTTVNAISTHPQKEKMLGADRETLFSACQKAASDGLMLDGKEAVLVSFYDKNKKADVVQYMPMVQGLVKLARNSGEITTIVAEVVFKDDKFSYKPGIDEQPLHDPDWFAEDRGEPVGVYAVVTLKSGDKISAMMPKKRVLEIAKGGKNGFQYDPEKGAHFQEWWKKTVIKNALKYAPKSTFLDSAIAADNEGYEFDEPPAHQPAQASAADINDTLAAQAADEPTSDVVSEQSAQENNPIV